MTQEYTGVRVYEVDSALIDRVYNDGQIEKWDGRLTFYPNMFVYLKCTDQNNNTKGAITIASKDGQSLKVIKDKKVSAFGVRPRNKEQTMAMSVMLDKDIPLNVMTGLAGSGKTMIAIACALELKQQKVYDRIIITRPMTQVGRHNLGALPGDINEKFGPYLENYITNIQQLVGNSKTTAQDLIAQFNIEAMPMQLIRGVSWVNTLIIADEIQTLNTHEMLTLGTRIGENSKLILMGDLKQRDEKIAKIDTGLHKLMNNQLIKESPLTSAIQLMKCERSELAKLFADVFEED